MQTKAHAGTRPSSPIVQLKPSSVCFEIIWTEYKTSKAMTYIKAAEAKAAEADAML